MEKNDLKMEQIERFVFDCEQLYQLNFDNSEYDISQNALIVRKFLLDRHNIAWLSKDLIDEKLILLCFGSDELEPELKAFTKIYIPIIEVLPIVRILNYTSIKLSLFEKKKQDGVGVNIKYPNVKGYGTSIDRYIKEDFLILDGKYICRRDVIEFLCYGKGAVHYGIDKKKLDRLKAVKKLSFDQAVGAKKADSAFTWKTQFKSPELEKQYLDSPEFSKYMMTLGDRHGFETLMLLQIIHEIRNSPSLARMYVAAKKHLIGNTYKYNKFNVDKFFGEQS